MSQQSIILIDDDPMIRLLVKEYLLAFGFKIECFERGSEGLASLKNNTPDLIVLDLQMPEMNGLEVLQNLRNDPSTAEIPVLMLSANASEAKSTSQITADNYLEKPFQMQDFLAAVQSTQRAQKQG